LQSDSSEPMLMQLVKAFCCYGTRILITLFTKDRHWNPFLSSWVQFRTSQPIFKGHFSTIFHQARFHNFA